MSHLKANRLQDFDAQVIRPALVEARLMTDKHLCDAVYVVTLTEELRDIEEKIARLEGVLGLQAAPGTAAPGVPWPASPGCLDAPWIRAKSQELETRLRRIELSAMADAGTVQ
jgi:hypothetical protein